MNAAEARELAISTTTQRQQPAISGVLAQIKHEAAKGHLSVTLFPPEDQTTFLKLHLESLGYVVKLWGGSQMDGPTLKVDW
jgi:hypothetical protein